MDLNPNTPLERIPYKKAWIPFLHEIKIKEIKDKVNENVLLLLLLFKRTIKTDVTEQMAIY